MWLFDFGSETGSSGILDDLRIFVISFCLLNRRISTTIHAKRKAKVIRAMIIESEVVMIVLVSYMFLLRQTSSNASSYFILLYKRSK